MQIMPIRDLKDTNGICERAKAANEPIFVTKNGYGALVVMNMEVYERTFAAAEIRRKLKEAEDEVASSAELLDGGKVLADLRAKYVR
jgi:PHD/YefM family antitoxin component YafN of YafNO toxin-antitoxin module